MSHEHFFQLHRGRILIKLFIIQVRRSGADERRILQVFVIELEVEFGLENLDLEHRDVLQLLVENLHSLVHACLVGMERSKGVDLLQLRRSLVAEVEPVVESCGQSFEDGEVLGKPTGLLPHAIQVRQDCGAVRFEHGDDLLVCKDICSGDALLSELLQEVLLDEFLELAGWVADHRKRGSEEHREQCL